MSRRLFGTAAAPGFAQCGLVKLAVGFTHEQIAKINALSIRDGRSLSEIVRRLIDDALGETP